MFLQIIAGKEKAFTYDYVFSPDIEQEEVYKTSIRKLIDGLFKGNAKNSFVPSVLLGP